MHLSNEKLLKQKGIIISITMSKINFRKTWNSAKEAMALEGAMDAVSSVTLGAEAGATGMASSGLEIENSLKSLEGAESSAANIGELDKTDDLEQVVNGEVY